ncbi:hypothetical protein [Silanimonas sp.]|jgi:hypothetical protein|uniref:hypothetical protein n=1 Tax=Silanimonas sp. TaxID=1929290 RepID=UPI002624C6FC|nr:hypothetical protein [Silanimonas sp.]
MSMLGLTLALAVAAAPEAATPEMIPPAAAQCVGQSVLIESRRSLRGAEAARTHEAVGRIVLQTPGLSNSSRTSFLRRSPATVGTAYAISRRTICIAAAEATTKGVVDPPDFPDIPLDRFASPGDTFVYSTCDPISRYKATYTLRYVSDKDGNPATKDPGWIIDKEVKELLTAGCPVE